MCLAKGGPLRTAFFSLHAQVCAPVQRPGALRAGTVRLSMPQEGAVP